MKSIHHGVRIWWRVRLAGAAAISVLLLGACSDGVEPVSIASIELHSDSSFPLAVGGTLMLLTDVRDTQGRSVRDPMLTWTTSDSAIATVDRNGVVTATGVGTVTITASVDGFQDSVVLTIGQVAVSGCDGQPIEVGVVRALAPGSDGVVCVPGGASYTMVVTNTAQSGSVILDLSGSRFTDPAPSLSLLSSGSLVRDEIGLERDWEAEDEIRARERTALRGLEGAARAARGRPGNGLRLSITPGVPALGSLLRLNTSTDACTNIDERVGRVMSVSLTTIIVADTANPKDGFTEPEFRQIGETMDTLVVPVVTEAFGAPTDIDSNERVVLFYTRAVNEMTPSNDSSYVGGFFYSRDLFPTEAVDGIQGCAGSNTGEIMYMLAPDPTGEVNENPRSKELVEEATIGVAAHELQHLINASRRLFIVEANSFDEEVWLNEGLSHIAEELVFYRASGLAPRQNITVTDLRQSDRRVDAFNRYAADNFGRLSEHLKSASTTSPYASNGALSTRGAAWSFLRYLADRRGGDEATFWQSLVSSKTTGMTNLRSAVGADPLMLVQDWAVATFADDHVFPISEIYTQPSWDFRSLYSALGSGRDGYPLSISTLDPAGNRLSVRAGGSVYLSVTTTSGTTGELRIQSGGGNPPTTVQIAALRTR